MATKKQKNAFETMLGADKPIPERLTKGDFETDKEQEKKSGGRPKKPDRARLVAYVSQAQQDAVRKYAYEHRTTYSDIVSALIDQYLDKLNPDTL